MKKNYLLLIVTILLSSMIVLGQAPQKIDFQAMARDGSGNPLLHQNIGVRISVIQGSTTVYTERHTLQTDDYGLFNLHIGDGTPLSGNFSSIDWSLGNHKIKVEIDPNGGYVYLNMGTSILTSSPYAFYGKDEDDNPINELQFLSINGNDLTISDGNTVTLPTGTGGDNWGSQTVESDATLSGDGTTSDPLGVVGDLTDDQTLSLAGNDLTITGGNTITLPTGGSAVWTQNGSDIYYDAGKVGIGTTTPDVDLHVEDRIRVGEDPIYSTVYGELSHEGGGNGFKINAHAGGGGWADMHLQTNGTTKMFIESSGKVGIGTTSPSATLEVNGTTKLGTSGVVISEIIEITGVTESSGSTTFFDYPAGYNKNNARVLSLGIHYGNTHWVSFGTGLVTDPTEVAILLGTQDMYIAYPDFSGYQNKPFRIILMKVE